MALKINKQYKLFGNPHNKTGDYDTVRVLNKFTVLGTTYYTLEYLSSTCTPSVFTYREDNNTYRNRKTTTFVKAVEKYVEPID